MVYASYKPFTISNVCSLQRKKNSLRHLTRAPDFLGYKKDNWLLKTLVSMLFCSAPDLLSVFICFLGGLLPMPLISDSQTCQSVDNVPLDDALPRTIQTGN